MRAYWEWVAEVPDEADRTDWLISHQAVVQSHSLAQPKPVSVPQIQRMIQKVADQFSSLVSITYIPLHHYSIINASHCRLRTIALSGAYLCTVLFSSQAQSFWFPNFLAIKGTPLRCGMVLALSRL